MAEEYIYERERDLLDYFRNNATDPDNRSKIVTDETHTMTVGQTEIILNKTLVKNVADLIDVGGSSKRKGKYYTVEYGEGKAITKVNLVAAATGGEVIKITYMFGPSFIEREYSRSDAQIPRVIIAFLTGSEEFAALGDYMESAKGSYFNASYSFEIRDKYATRTRQLASQIFNLGRKLRHANLFRTNITQVTELENLDFDPDKDCYIWRFNLDIQWEIMFT